MKEEIKEVLTEIKNSLFRVEKDLEYHIKRTDLLESFMKNQIKVLLSIIVAIIGFILTK